MIDDTSSLKAFQAYTERSSIKQGEKRYLQLVLDPLTQKKTLRLVCNKELSPQKKIHAFFGMHEFKMSAIVTFLNSEDFRGTLKAQDAIVFNRTIQAFNTQRKPLRYRLLRQSLNIKDATPIINDTITTLGARIQALFTKEEIVAQDIEEIETALKPLLEYASLLPNSATLLHIQHLNTQCTSLRSINTLETCIQKLSTAKDIEEIEAALCLLLQNATDTQQQKRITNLLSTFHMTVINTLETSIQALVTKEKIVAQDIEEIEAALEPLLKYVPNFPSITNLSNQLAILKSINTLETRIQALFTKEKIVAQDIEEIEAALEPLLKYVPNFPSITNLSNQLAILKSINTLETRIQALSDESEQAITPDLRSLFNALEVNIKIIIMQRTSLTKKLQTYVQQCNVMTSIMQRAVDMNEQKLSGMLDEIQKINDVIQATELEIQKINKQIQGIGVTLHRFFSHTQNKNYSPALMSKIEQLVSLFHAIGGVGIVNMQQPAVNVCFMNSTIQALRNTPGFRAYLDQLVNNREGIGKCPLAQSLKKIFEKIEQQETVNAETIYAFRQQAQQEGFRQGEENGVLVQQEDAQEFALFLLGALGFPTFSLMSHVKHTAGFPLVSLQNKQDANMLSLSIYANVSINDLINHVHETVTLDRNEIIRSASYQGFNSETQKQVEIFFSDEGKKAVETEQKIQIFGTAPQMLPIQLKRFDYSLEKGTLKKRQDLIDASRTIQVELIDNEQQVVATANYTLTAVTVHGGDSLNAGHYYSYVPQNIGDTTMWVKYNDSAVSIEEYETIQMDIQMNGYLFYYTLDSVENVIST